MAVASLAKSQAKLYADERFSVLLIFQAMDAGGKDGTVRAVLSGINPAGCEVHSFKQPSARELQHDFLWRAQSALPSTGRIGVFNRSYYEDVLIVRVNPSLLEAEHLPDGLAASPELWQQRFTSIVDAEAHWARNGIVILKFFLNVSKAEQKRRLLERIDNPEGNWKFSADDLGPRKQWAQYMEAYQDALNATSRPWAPWYAIPADDKAFAHRTVAEIVVKTVGQLDLRFPRLAAAEQARLTAARAELEREH